MRAPIIPAAELEPGASELADSRRIVEGRPYATAALNVGGRADFAVEELARALAAGDAPKVARLVRQMRADARALDEFHSDGLAVTAPEGLAQADLEPDAGIIDAAARLNTSARTLQATIADAAVDLDRALSAGDASGAALLIREIRSYAQALVGAR